MLKIHAAIFDLDGVLVDTARFHYIAWKELANELGFNFSEADNEHLKGVSRMRSLDILLQMGNMRVSDSEKISMAERKNERYKDLLQSLDTSDLLPGSQEYLMQLRGAGIKIALGSASKNAGFILEKLKICSLFDAVIDGNKVDKAKPDPEVFLKGAAALAVPPEFCTVFEDALAGVQAAKTAHMQVVAVGSRSLLPGADFYVKSLADLVS